MASEIKLPDAILLQIAAQAHMQWYDDCVLPYKMKVLIMKDEHEFTWYKIRFQECVFHQWVLPEQCYKPYDSSVIIPMKQISADKDTQT